MKTTEAAWGEYKRAACQNTGDVARQRVVFTDRNYDEEMNILLVETMHTTQQEHPVFELPRSGFTPAKHLIVKPVVQVQQPPG